jgi:hypothetical protein
VKPSGRVFGDDDQVVVTVNPHPAIGFRVRQARWVKPAMRVVCWLATRIARHGYTFEPDPEAGSRIGFRIESE